MNPPVYTGSKIAEDLEEDFREALLHDSMEISRLIIHVQQVGKTEGRQSKLGQGKGQDKLRRIFQGRVLLKSGIIQGLRRDSPTMGSQFHPRVAMIGNPILELREIMKYMH